MYSVRPRASRSDERVYGLSGQAMLTKVVLRLSIGGRVRAESLAGSPDGGGEFGERRGDAKSAWGHPAQEHALFTRQLGTVLTGSAPALVR
jgi:hypothetical protein